MKKAIFDHKATAALIRYCFFLLLMCLSAITFGQTRGKVQVIRDPLFDTLLAKRAMLNTGGRTSSGGYSFYGYRVQIYSGSNRSAAYSAQARFNNQFPDMRTYIIYREPNFKVRAGDFRTRIDAERMKNQLIGTFSAMFIISEKINPPKTVINDD